MNKMHSKVCKNTESIKNKYKSVIRLYQKNKKENINGEKLKLFFPIIDKIKYIEKLENNKKKKQ